MARRIPGGTWSDDGEDNLPAADDAVEPSVEGRYAPTGEVLGQGGLGKVDAVRDRDLGREVARKQSLSDDSAHRQRFLREARVTAQLEHPGIVPVYELGQDADGRPFYTMRRIRGRTLGAVLAECRGLRDRLALLPTFVTVCQAVAFAHSRGVIHRDLKPDNVMVGEFGETLLVDWGLAKVGDDEKIDVAPSGLYAAAAPKGASLTRIGATLGTPAYMSPEQARGDADSIDGRADVWGLGAILFELLAGRPPFAGVPGDVAVKKLRNNEFEAIDDVLRDAPPELVAIVRKACAIRPEARYANAGDFAADVLKWQAGGLVDAYHYSLREVVGRAISRHRGAFSVAAIALVALVIAGTYSQIRVRSERDRAVAAEQIAAAGEVESRARLARSLGESADAALRADDALSAYVLALGSLDIAESPLVRGTLLAAAADPLPDLVASTHLEGPCAIPALAPDGALACWSRGSLLVWTRFPSVPTTLPVPGEASDEAWSITWSPSGKRLFAVHYDGGAWLWDRGDAAVRSANLPKLITAAFLDEDHAVITTDDGRIGVATLGGGGPVWSTRHAVVEFDAIAAVADGTVIVGSVVDPVRRWDPRTDTWTEVADTPLVAPLIGASADGRAVVAGGGWGSSMSPPHLVREGVVHDLDRPQPIAAIAISASGDRSAVAGKRSVTVWDGPEWRLRARVPTDARVVGVALSGDGHTLVVAEGDGDLRQWRLPVQAGQRPRDAGGTVWDARITDDGALIASGGNDPWLRTWDPVNGELSNAWPVDPSGTGFLTVDGHDAIATMNTLGVWRMSLDDGTVRWKTPVSGVMTDIQRLKDGGFVISIAGGEVVRLLSDGKIAWRKPVGEWSAAVGESGDDLFVVSALHLVRLDPATGVQRSSLAIPGLTDIAVPTPDGGLFAGVIGQAIHLSADGRTLATFAGFHEGKIRSLATSDRLWATSGDDGRVCLWTPDGAPRACWSAHQGPVWRVVFSPDGERTITAGGDGAVRVWGLDLVDASVAELLTSARARFGLAPGDGAIREVSER